MKLNLKQLERMLEAVTDQVNDERESAAQEEVEYDDPLWPDQAENNTQRGFLLARLEEALHEMKQDLEKHGRVVIDVEES